MTIGLVPAFASTGFGYIELGAPLDVTGAPTARRVERFVEKPDAPTARPMSIAGSVGTQACSSYGPRRCSSCSETTIRRWRHRCARSLPPGTDRTGRTTAARIWPTVEAIAIDHAVAEPAAAAGRVACIPADFGWDDVGDWAALAGLLPEPAAGAPRVLGDETRVRALDSSGLVVPAGGRDVVVIGLADIVVVDTPDAVLVMPAAQAQRVKDIVAALKAGHRSDLL